MDEKERSLGCLWLFRGYFGGSVTPEAPPMVWFVVVNFSDKCTSTSINPLPWTLFARQKRAHGSIIDSNGMMVVVRGARGAMVTLKVQDRMKLTGTGSRR
jgi:hypothetical protein